MRFQIKTISIRKSLFIYFLSIPFILVTSIGLAILLNIDWLVYLIIPELALVIFFTIRLSKSSTLIELDKGKQFKINDQEILYENVIGYYINDTGLIQTELSLKLNRNKFIRLNALSIGKKGKEFKEVKNVIIETLKRKNDDLQELSYGEAYVRQIKILKPFFYFLSAIILLVDAALIYQLFTGNMDLPWQIFFVNFLFFGLVPHLKKEKRSE